jgi:ATP-dependent Clp protease ATP-binding subunit ClpA
MFERFSDRARRVVVLAQEEARRLNHNYIGTEHLLLALVHEGEGVAAQALESLGITLAAARQQVEQIVGRGQEGPRGHIPFTPRAKNVLEFSVREASQLGHAYVGTEHLLLGLIREGDGKGVQVLTDLAVDPNQVRQRVIQVLHRNQGGDRLTSLEARVSALERRVGTTAPDLRDLEREIDQVRREKEAAIAAQDFDNAATLRDRENRLLGDRSARQQEWAASPTDLPSLTDEVERLRDLLRQHGIDPQDGAA